MIVLALRTAFITGRTRIAVRRGISPARQPPSIPCRRRTTGSGAEWPTARPPAAG